MERAHTAMDSAIQAAKTIRDAVATITSATTVDPTFQPSADLLKARAAAHAQNRAPINPDQPGRSTFSSTSYRYPRHYWGSAPEVRGARYLGHTLPGGVNAPSLMLVGSHSWF